MDLDAAVAAVWEQLGPGRPETAYSAALAMATGGDHQFPVPVRFNGTVVSVTKADVVIAPAGAAPTVIEVKIADRATPEAMEQARAYARSISSACAVAVVAFPRTAAVSPSIAHGTRSSAV
jgi:hypothetical protein